MHVLRLWLLQRVLLPQVSAFPTTLVSFFSS
jgi:hypothetical protein